MGGSTYTQHFYDVEYAPINADGSLGAWKTANSLPTGNYYSCNVTAYNGYIYACFGKYASINADGTIGTWQSTSSPTNGGSILLANNRYIYSITNNAGGNTIQYAPINTDGTVGSWLTANQGSEPSAPYWFGASIYNGYLYLLGGPNTISYAAIMANGTLAAWQNTSPLPTGTYYPGTAAYNGYIYALGGITSNGSNSPQSTVQYAKIDPAGVTASYAATSSFTTTRSGFGTVAYNGYLYVMGGSNSSNYLNDVQYAPLNANGTVGTWQTTTSFTTARNNFGTVAYNGYLYIMGGYNGSLIFNDVQYAPINANGTLGAWSTTSSFTTSRDNFGAVAYAGYLYVVAGRNGSNSPLSDVQYAPINADGTIGTWQATTSLATARKSLGAVAYGGYLYAMGGFDSTGSPLNDVQYAPINANGTLGAWQATTSLPVPRNYAGAVAYDGYVYVTGGYDNGSSLGDVQYAAINANGTLGAWQATTGLPSARLGVSDVVYNGYLYTMGGSGGSSAPQYTPLNSIARVGHYSKLIDLGSAVSVTGVTFSSVSGGAASVNYRAAGADGVFGASGSINDMPGGCTSGAAGTRYLLLMVTLDDSYGQGTGGAWPDSSGTPANVTDLTVNYSTGHPPPNIRLRDGQTMQQGNLSALDTCS